MAKVINISDKLNNEKSSVQIGEKKYPVNDGVGVIITFQELAETNSVNKIIEGIKLAIGDKAVKELKADTMSIHNLKVLMIAIFAAMLDIEYEEAEKRFQDAK